MDLQAFFKLSYGLYVISARSGEKNYGCVVNTLQQVAAEPPMLSVAVNKNSVTAKAILDSGRFCGTVLTGLLFASSGAPFRLQVSYYPRCVKVQGWFCEN